MGRAIGLPLAFPLLLGCVPPAGIRMSGRNANPMSVGVSETITFDGIVSAHLNGNHGCSSIASGAMKALDRVVGGIAATDIPVLIVGEIGAGKHVLAAEIHRRSRQADGAFVHVSCSSLSASDLADWLRTQVGQDQANPGTLYLDELSALDADCQAKLLQALPASNGFPGNARFGYRVISSTGRDLQEEMRQQRFREELYYRINGACLRVPPLRQRREDIPLLIEHFLIKYAAAFDRPRPKLGPRTMEVLIEHPWPGNVRELENVVKKIVALGDEEVAIADLPSSSNPREPLDRPDGLSLKRASRQASMQAEKELILKALGKTRWNRKRAAQELRISYKALLYKLKQIGVDESPSS